MTRKLMLASAIAAALTGHPALALELGALRTDSALNQPFQGEIDLGDIGPDELDTLRLSIASPEAFEKAGIERYYSLTQLRFSPEVMADGRLRVRVSSRDPVREPYLDFLVEAVWPSGRLVKGYTVLLDPPTQTERRAPNVRTARAGAAVGGSEPGRPGAVSDAGTYIAAPGEGFPVYIGPVGGGEGLWSLARRHATAGASDAQTAMALYRCNQGAFVRGDINRLIAGKMLVIPSRAELFALDAEEARRELQAALRGRPVQRAPLTDVTPETLARLRLVGTTPGVTGPAVSAPPTAAGMPSAGTAIQSPDVLLAIETSETARQETIELRNRIKELETQLADIQSLLQLRDAELARAQVAENSTPGIAAEPEPESRLESEPIEVPESSTPQPGVLGPEPVASTEAEPSDLQPPSAETALETPEPEPGPEPGSVPTESGSASGLVPVPIPSPAEPGTPSDSVPEPPVPKVATEPVTTPAPAPASAPVVPREPEPVPTSSSTWHSLLLPLAGLAGVTALGILLFSLLTARRRRREQANPEDDLESELMLDVSPTMVPESGAESESGSGSGSGSGSESESEPSSRPAARAAEPSAALSLAKPRGAAKPAVQPTSALASTDLDDTQSDGLSDLTGFDAETDEADVLSEADIYIAYGRHREARNLLRKEIQRYPHRLDIKYKLAEALVAAGEIEELRDLLDEIRASGGDAKEPAKWERMRRALLEKELALSAPPVPTVAPSLNPSAVLAASAGLGASGALSETRESVAVPELESIVGLDSESEDDLLLDLGDSVSLESEEIGASHPFDDSLKLELDAESLAPSSGELALANEPVSDAIPPEAEAFGGLDLDLESLGEASAPSIDSTDALDLRLEVPELDEIAGDLDLVIDGLGIEGESRAFLEPPMLVEESSDKAHETLESLEVSESGLSPEQESLSSDLLSSQWQIDSGIWDETATKLDLARAYMEMDDKEAAREILEEVMAEGREEQRNEARAMLERLGR